jgi:hypothetical protein
MVIVAMVHPAERALNPVAQVALPVPGLADERL